MKRAALCVIVSGGLLSSGCATVNRHISNYSANTPAFNPYDVGRFATRQSAVMDDFARLAGVQTPASGGEWRQVIDAGIHYADVRCDRFMDALFWFNRVRETTSRQIQFTGAAASAAMSILEASVSAIGLTPLGFTFLDQTVNNFGSGLLFSVNPSNVRTIVERQQAAYRRGLSASYTSRAIALQTIQDYAAICLPPSIETQVEEAIATQQFQRQSVAPELPAGPGDQVPDAFGFPDLNDRPVSTHAESAWMRVRGIGSSTTISVAGGNYQIEDGTPTNANGMVAPNERVRVSTTTDAALDTPTTVTLTIGGVEGRFTVRTAPSAAAAAAAPAVLPDATTPGPAETNVNVVPVVEPVVAPRPPEASQ